MHALFTYVLRTLKWVKQIKVTFLEDNFTNKNDNSETVYDIKFMHNIYVCTYICMYVCNVCMYQCM